MWALVILPLLLLGRADQVRAWQGTWESRYPYTLYQVHALLDLNLGWKTAEGERVSFPFIRPDSLLQEEWVIQLNVDIFCALPDTVFMVVAGASWEVGLELNDRYIGTNTVPLAPWVVPLQREWLREKGNRVRLIFGGGQRITDFPPPFLGLLEGVFLLDRDQLDHWSTPLLPVDPSADSVMVMAPYFGKAGLAYSEKGATALLLHVEQQGISHVYFPFPAPRKFRALLAEAGLRRVDSLRQGMKIAMLNAYPHTQGDFHFPESFWLDPLTHRRASYGLWWGFGEKSNGTQAPALTGGLVLLMLFPILALTLIKLLSPQFFQSSNKLLLKPGLYLDLISEFSSGNVGIVLLLVLIKILSLAACVTLWVQYLDLNNQWDGLNLITDQSLMFQWLYGVSSLGGIWGRVMLGFLLIFAFKITLIQGLSRIFRIRAMLSNSMDLEIIGAYPLVMVLPLPVAMMFFISAGGQSAFLIFLASLGAVYLLRRLFVAFIGLDQLFGFSLGMKILYICALDIVPYLIWL